jgi:hypothetical protein
LYNKALENIPNFMILRRRMPTHAELFQVAFARVLRYMMWTGMKDTPSAGSAVVTLTAASFNCDFCSLDLNGADELKASGLPIQWNIEDVDPAVSDPDYP